MPGEFKRRIELLGLGEESKTKILNLIQEAANEFGCLACPSKDTCENFKWYTKWFTQ